MRERESRWMADKCFRFWNKKDKWEKPWSPILPLINFFSLYYRKQAHLFSLPFWNLVTLPCLSSSSYYSLPLSLSLSLLYITLSWTQSSSYNYRENCSLLEPHKNTQTNMGRAPCCDKANVKKGPWSPEEDATLKAYIEQNGTGGNWIALPQKIGNYKSINLVYYGFHFSSVY